MNEITAFFAFLRCCLGGKDNMSNVIANIDWLQLYSFASRHCWGFALRVLRDWGRSILRS